MVGALMGAAEIVPGVSGGTIAFISGIYERLLNCLQRFTPALFAELRTRGPMGVWELVDGSFLAALFGAMLISIVAFANVISYLLSSQPIAVWSFFCGLVLASSWVVGRQTRLQELDTYLAIGVGVIVGYSVTHLVPVEISPTPVALFFGGMIAVCAWILPGVSGSFVLLILGLYTSVVEAVKSLEVISLLSLGCGCAIGLVSFSRVLTVLFDRSRNVTLAVLTGFMVGSMVKLWPWKSTVVYQLKSDGSRIPIVEEPMMPHTYEMLTGEDSQLLIAALTALGGCMLVVSLHWFAVGRAQDVLNRRRT